ncbi:MAG: glycosyltransferase [Tabrizicola sp.]|nr:glycosyltransferase [Tabrizicola sp.]
MPEVDRKQTRSKAPGISVIVPTFKDWHLLQLCLDCLANQSIGQDKFEVIVANNNLSDEIPSSLRLAANARVVHAAKPGSYTARNVAIAKATGDVFFFTDSDCLPDRQWIEAGLAELSGLGPLGRVAGAVEVFPSGQKWTGPELFERLNAFRVEFYVSCGWGITANLGVRRAVFDLVGPFDETYFSGGDRDWNLRARALGCELAFCAKAIVRHPARATFSDLARKRRRVLGGQHQDEIRGNIAKGGLFGHLFPFQLKDVRRIAVSPGLSNWQILQVLWVTYLLGIVSFVEVFRLRHLSGRARRS